MSLAGKRYLESYELAESICTRLLGKDGSVGRRYIPMVSTCIDWRIRYPQKYQGLSKIVLCAHDLSYANDTLQPAQVEAVDPVEGHWLVAGLLHLDFGELG